MKTNSKSQGNKSFTIKDLVTKASGRNIVLAVLDQCRGFVNEDTIEILKRRITGEYFVDEWGFDEELAELCRPIMSFIYKKYWRVTVSGIENIPSEGRALLVANHSGVLPYDGAMMAMAIQEEHPKPRILRCLHLSLFSAIPIVGIALARVGQVQALNENGEKLLNQDHLVGVFPEGLKGVGKPFKDRYRLARFGRGGFVNLALKAKSPIIPVSVIGAEEIHPLLYNVKPIAKLVGLPYVPVTPTFPWLGPLGLLPFPTKWYIHFDKPIPLQDIKYKPSEEPLLISQITAQVRNTIQNNIYERLKQRRSIFW